MWASLITLVALLGHTSGLIHQSSPWNTFDTSSLFHPKQQCVQQVIDADSLLKIVTKIVDDIPNICLSKFKLCGGFEAPASSPLPPPPPYFPEFRTNDIPEEDVVEEVFEDGNGTETSSEKTRQRRATTEDESHGHGSSKSYGHAGYGHGGFGSYGLGGYGSYGLGGYGGYGLGGYGGYGLGGYGGYGYGGYGLGGYGGYGHGYKHLLYAPRLDYYAPEHYHRVSLWSLAYKNPAFKNAYFGHHYHKKNYGETPEAVY